MCTIENLLMNSFEQYKELASRKKGRTPNLQATLCTIPLQQAYPSGEKRLKFTPKI